MNVAPGGLNEAEMAGQIAEGNERAFFLLFTAYSPLIRPFARKIALSEKAAEDILQETFIRIWLSRDKLANVENLKGWVFTVAANECMRYMRNKLTYEKKTEELQHRQEQDPYCTPLDFVQANEISRIVQSIVNKMPAQRKTIYQMSRNQGLKPAAIADQLSLSVGTVKNVLSGALKEIRQGLVQSGITVSLLLYHFY